MAFLILYWGQLHSTAVSAFRVIEHFDVIENITSGLITCRVDSSSDSLPLQKLEKAFGYGIIMTVSASAHAADHIVGFQEALPI
jgi:hypothetical protein